MQRVAHMTRLNPPDDNAMTCCCHCYIIYLHPLALNDRIGDPVLCIASDGFGLLHSALCFVAVPLHNAPHTIMWPASRQSDAALRREGGRLGKQTYGAGLLATSYGNGGLNSSRCIIKWKSAFACTSTFQPRPNARECGPSKAQIRNLP